MCNNCIHQPVCSIYRATGGVKKCEHHKEERKGEWKQKRLNNFRMWEVRCSECGWWGIEDYDQYDNPSNFNFCPECGADMRGEEDG